MTKIGLVDGDRVLDKIGDCSCQICRKHRYAVKSCRVPLQPPAKIEAAIRVLETYADEYEKGIKSHTVLTRLSFLEVAGALAFARWSIDREQQFFSDADFGLPEKGGEEE